MASEEVKMSNILEPKNMGQIIFYREMLRLSAAGCEWASSQLDRYESSRYPIHNVFHPLLNRWVLIVVWDYHPPAGVFRRRKIRDET